MHLTHPTGRHASKRTVRRSKARLGVAALASSVSVLGAGVLAGQAAAQPSSPPTTNPSQYQFQTINNNNDPTFNQLLGINQRGLIAGYFGSGADAAHPNKGYTLTPRYRQRNFHNENFPGSAQTQVVGVNDRGVTVGFWVDQNGANFGFYKQGGRFHSVNFPTAMNNTMNASPAVNQLLGVNDRNIAVGFYTDSNGNSHGYSYNIRTRQFQEITIAGSTDVTAAAINRFGDIAGFYANPNDGLTDGFVLDDGNLTTLAVPGASQTQATGINDSGEVVGNYTVGTGDNAVMHGFTWTRSHGFKTVDDPNGIGATVVNGVNDKGQLVGFYTDANGNTDGMLATPHQGTWGHGSSHDGSSHDGSSHHRSPRHRR